MPARRYTHRKKIARFAAEVLAKQPVYLDTETTGIDRKAEIVEIAVLDSDGEALLDTLIKPVGAIPYQVSQIHGIDNDMVADAPTLVDIWQELEAILQQRPVVIYNSAFDLRLLAQSARHYDIFPAKPLEVYCAMLAYAEFHGNWDDYRESYVWQRLHEALQQCHIKLPPALHLHRAAADCTATRLLMLHMAAKAEKSDIAT